MRETTYRIKPLVWVEQPSMAGGVPLHRARVGRLMIFDAWEEPAGRWNVQAWDMPDERTLLSGATDSLEDAKAWAEQHYRAELAKALEEVGDGE